MLLNIRVFLPPALEWSVQSVIFAKHSFAMDANAYKPMHVHAHWLMPYALNVNAMFTNTVAEYSIVHSVHRFYVKMINLSIKQNVKLSNRKVTNVNRVTKWVNTHVYVAKHAIVMIMYVAKDLNTKRMHRFHAQSAITRHRKRKTSACQHVRISLVVKVPMITMTMMMIIKIGENEMNLMFDLQPIQVLPNID